MAEIFSQNSAKNVEKRYILNGDQNLFCGLSMIDSTNDPQREKINADLEMSQKSVKYVSCYLPEAPHSPLVLSCLDESRNRCQECVSELLFFHPEEGFYFRTQIKTILNGERHFPNLSSCMCCPCHATFITIMALKNAYNGSGFDTMQFTIW